MDANRYFSAMHNAMSTQHTGAKLLLTVELQDVCGNDAYMELKQVPGESTAVLCYSTMGRRCLNFQLFRKGWQLCHNTEGQLTGRFPASAEGLLTDADFRAYCREDRLDMARTQRILAELRPLAGTDYQGAMPQNARTGAVVTVDSFVGSGAHWTYWNQSEAPCLSLAAILYWLADFLAGSERRALQSDPRAAQLASYWLTRDTAVFFHPSASLNAADAGKPVHTSGEHRQGRSSVPTARNKSWQSIVAAMAAV